LDLEEGVTTTWDLLLMLYWYSLLANDKYLTYNYSQSELSISGSLLGYRAMHLRLQQTYNLKVSRYIERLYI
jgi:hypothetical protein